MGIQISLFDLFTLQSGHKKVKGETQQMPQKGFTANLEQGHLISGPLKLGIVICIQRSYKTKLFSPLNLAMGFVSSDPVKQGHLIYSPVKQGHLICIQRSYKTSPCDVSSPVKLCR